MPETKYNLYLEILPDIRESYCRTVRDTVGSLRDDSMAAVILIPQDLLDVADKTTAIRILRDNPAVEAVDLLNPDKLHDKWEFSEDVPRVGNKVLYLRFKPYAEEPFMTLCPPGQKHTCWKTDG